jgi:Tol biopolymer transport system component
VALASAVAADNGKLLVDTYGKLLLIGTDGTQQVLSESIIVAALSPDGRRVAFTHDENPRAFPNSSQIVSVVSIAGGTVERIAELPAGSHFGSVDWLPDGSGIVYEGKDGDLFIAPISPNGSAPRNLGPWYQGFSISPDGSKIVHAVNSPAMGLEILDMATGSGLSFTRPEKLFGARSSPPTANGSRIRLLSTIRRERRTTNPIVRRQRLDFAFTRHVQKRTVS